jgi:hypothetical protein
MGVVDELIGSVCCRSSICVVHADVGPKIKFIKFFAWEDRWIDRAMAAREEEMKWMVKRTFADLRAHISFLTRRSGCWNNVMFSGFVICSSFRRTF